MVVTMKYKLTWQLPVFNNCDLDTSTARYSKSDKKYDASDDPRQSYTLFPNPNSGSITLQQYIVDTKPITAVLYNSMGTKVKTQTLTFNSYLQSVNFTGLPPGLYLLQLTNSKNRYFDLKFVIE